MEIRLQVKDVLSINKTLSYIIEQNKDLDSLFKFRLLGIMKSIESSVVNFEMIRNEKIVEYGKPGEDGNYSIPSTDEESISKYNNEMNRILNSDTSINIEKLNANDIFTKGIKTEQLLVLYPIIEV